MRPILTRLFAVFLIGILLILPGCFKADLDNAADPNNPENLTGTAAIAIGLGFGSSEEEEEEEDTVEPPAPLPTDCVFDDLGKVFDTCTWAP